MRASASIFAFHSSPYIPQYKWKAQEAHPSFFLRLTEGPALLLRTCNPKYKRKPQYKPGDVCVFFCCFLCCCFKTHHLVGAGG
jgi:hypothetical protein